MVPFRSPIYGLCLHPYGMHPQTIGFSPGLKNMPPACFLPAFLAGRPLRIPRPDQNKRAARAALGTFRSPIYGLCLHPYGMHPQTIGFSPGLKNMPRHVFCQHFVLAALFESRAQTKIKGLPEQPFYFGRSGGIRTRGLMDPNLAVDVASSGIWRQFVAYYTRKSGNTQLLLGM